MSEPAVRVTQQAAVVTVELNRPEARNALDTRTKVALLAALRDVATEPSVRCLALTGSGAVFCSGQDLKEHAAALAAGDLDGLFATVPEHYNPIALALHELDVPVIAGVNGIAAGAGTALALLADYRLLSESAGINVAFARIGLSCDTGTSWTLPRLVGPTRAMELLLNARTVSASEALAIGLATEVVPADQFQARLTELAATLATGPTLAYAAIRHSLAFSASHSLAESLEFEGGQMRRTGATEDHRLAVESFLGKQSPTFTGR